MKVIRTNTCKEVKVFAETFEYEAYEQVKKLANYEAPQAYKSMEEIRTAITDTVDIIDIIRPIYNFKASE